MREPANILDVGMLQPDFMGFIFYDQSPRCVPSSFEIPSKLNQSIKKVGVFVNENFEKVFEVVNRHELDFAQLHGDEPVSFCEKLKQAEIGVIKVFSIDDDFDFKLVNPYKKVVDYFLFDTRGKHRGGNASTFDWNLLEQYDQEIPFFLSGGISPSNVGDGMQLKNLNLYGFDVNSGVENEPGMKDVNKIRELKKVIA
jgi:phosphoribosylanthranilate isomerase